MMNDYYRFQNNNNDNYNNNKNNNEKSDINPNVCFNNNQYHDYSIQLKNFIIEQNRIEQNRIKQKRIEQNKKVENILLRILTN